MPPIGRSRCGLLGLLPAEIDPDAMEAMLVDLGCHKVLRHAGLPPLAFDPAASIVFDYGPPLPGHPNGMVFVALDSTGSSVLEQTYYSIGGGFVATPEELVASADRVAEEVARYPYPFDDATSMLRMAREHGLSIAAMKRANELLWREPHEFDARLAGVWDVMDRCIERGLAIKGVLPGELKVKRPRRRHRREAGGRKELEPEAAVRRLRVAAGLPPWRSTRRTPQGRESSPRRPTGPLASSRPCCATTSSTASTPIARRSPSSF